MNFLDRPIHEIDMSVRTTHCLKSAGVNTLRDVVDWADSDFLRIDNFGRKSLNEIKVVLASEGLSLAQPSTPKMVFLSVRLRQEVYQALKIKSAISGLTVEVEVANILAKIAEPIIKAAGSG